MKAGELGWSWFRRLGLQRRIMLYVALGLAFLFTIGAYVGLVAIREATEMVYHERLGIAVTTASMLDHNLQLLAHDVESVGDRLFRASSPQQLEDAAADLLVQVSAARPYPLVHGGSLWLLDKEGQGHLALSDADTSHAPLTPDISAAVQQETLLVSSASPEDPHFGTLVVPLRDSTGVVQWTVMLRLVALNQDRPYLPSSSQAALGAEEPSDEYGLEILSPEGRVVLTRGGSTTPGEISGHWQLFQQEHPQYTSPFILMHQPRQGQRFAPHIVVAAPLSSGPFLVTLEQPVDVALALPRKLRQSLIIFGSLGFVATMLVAWVTTRHVVKPTEQLTGAARRIAAGELETSLNLGAQDEIGILAESLETMRRRLQAWGSELENQVQQRTAELDERNRELRALYETLQGKEEQLRTLLAKVLGAQEEERKRLSRELHDGIGQALSALVMGLEGPDHHLLGQRGHLEAHVERLKELATDTLRDLRRMAIALRPAALDDLGLVPAIRRYVELFLEPAGVDFQIHEEESQGRLDSSLETVVYRVVQEAINNVVRHSGASHAGLHLRSVGTTFVVTVEDNGHGFDPNQAASRRGVGLQGMEERAALVGGRLTIISQPNEGTTVRLEIPLAEKRRDPRDANSQNTPG